MSNTKKKKKKKKHILFLLLLPEPLPSRSLSNVSAVVQSVAGPVPFTVIADTRNEYSVPRSRPGWKSKHRSETQTQEKRSEDGIRNRSTMGAKHGKKHQPNFTHSHCIFHFAAFGAK